MARGTVFYVWKKTCTVPTIVVTGGGGERGGGSKSLNVSTGFLFPRL